MHAQRIATDTAELSLRARRNGVIGLLRVPSWPSRYCTLTCKVARTPPTPGEVDLEVPGAGGLAVRW